MLTAGNLEGFDPVAFVDDHVWTFARRMPHIPHEYLVRGKKDCVDEDWDSFAAYIKEHGYRARWTAPNGRHMDNIYLELGEWKFWVIFPMINRERIENSTTQRLDSETDGDRPPGDGPLGVARVRFPAEWSMSREAWSGRHKVPCSAHHWRVDDRMRQSSDSDGSCSTSTARWGGGPVTGRQVRAESDA